MTPGSPRTPEADVDRRPQPEGEDGLAVPASAGPHAAALTGALLETADPHVLGVLLYGSQLVGTAPGPHSGYDMVVVVDAYRSFYRRLVDAGHHPRPPGVLTALARVLPPNVVAFMPGLPGDPLAKCLVLTGQDLERALAPRARDHFVKGRLAQRVAIAYAADRKARVWMAGLLDACRHDVLRWAGPFLPESFDAELLARRMLRVSYGGELRPEAKDRVEEVFRGQRDAVVSIYQGVLEEAARRGVVEPVGEGRYRFEEPPGRLDRLRIRLYFARSKLRATLRWLKHVLTFADWLTYIRRKVERRTGRPIELTERERRYPLIFLWPRVFQVLRELPEREPSDETAEGEEKAP